MQQMLKTKKEEDEFPANPSAFQNIGSFGKSPTLSAISSSNRDSGYGTDYSPASITSTSRRFTYDDGDDYLSEVMDDMDINRDNDVFAESHSETIFECIETDDTDREVEGLLNEDAGSRRTISQPIQIKRPSAPIPTPEDKTEDDDDSVKDLECVNIAEPWVHTRHMKRNRFRPISRSVGTQTPSPHSQIIREAIGNVNALGRFQPYARGSAVIRLRLRSESEDVDCMPPLPDIVPMSRDRSISLPDVPSFRRREQEQEVGRELRRISDEFNSSFTRVRSHTVHNRHASSFPSMVVHFDFQVYWNRLRRMMSSSPIFQPRGEQTDERKCHHHDGPH